MGMSDRDARSQQGGAIRRREEVGKDVRGMCRQFGESVDQGGG